MRVTKEEQSLTEMLIFAGIPKLPEKLVESENPLKEDNIWCKALARIQRINGEIDYVVVEHDLFGWNELKIKKSSGESGVAHSLLGVYPYEFLRPKNIPEVSTKKDIIDFVSHYVNEDLEYLQSLKKDVLKKMFYNVCIRLQNYKDGNYRPSGYYNLGIKEPKQDGKENGNESNGAIGEKGTDGAGDDRTGIEF